MSGHFAPNILVTKIWLTKASRSFSEKIALLSSASAQNNPYSFPLCGTKEDSIIGLI